MTLHPFSPPGLITYCLIALIIAGFVLFVKPGHESRFLTIIKTGSSFIPVVVASVWQLWSITIIGRSGYTGLVSPDEVLATIAGSFWLGTAITCGLFVLNLLLPILFRHDTTVSNK
jgi:hypothetical protein